MVESVDRAGGESQPRQRSVLVRPRLGNPGSALVASATWLQYRAPGQHGTLTDLAVFWESQAGVLSVSFSLDTGPSTVSIFSHREARLLVHRLGKSQTFEWIEILQTYLCITWVSSAAH